MKVQNKVRNVSKSEVGIHNIMTNEKNSVSTNSLKSLRTILRNKLLEIKTLIKFEYLFSGSFFTGITKCKHKRNIK